jgi:peptidoglycan/xylan/chitin deacetylase (PgdA/CDA1 family)
VATSVRNYLGKILANALIYSGLVKKAAQKVQRGNYIISLCFHAPSKAFFESCVTWLSKNGFHFISVCEIERIINEEKPFPKGAVVITIDDGWQSNLDNIVPVAVQNEVPVAIFVSTEVVEKGSGYWWSYIMEARKMGLSRESVEFFKTLDNEDRIKIIEETKSKIQINREALTIDQVREISKNKYVAIGSHSVSHPILPRCSNIESKYEISHSKEIIEEWIEKDVKFFAFPNGDYSNREISFLKKFGYTLAFSTEQKYLTKEKLAHRFSLPRFMMVEGASFEENICRIVGVWPLKPKKRKIVYP